MKILPKFLGLEREQEPDDRSYVRVMGEEIAVRAAIHSIGSYSAHADRDGLLEWLKGFSVKPRAVFLVHGEDTVLENWAATVRQELRWRPVVPVYGETYLLAETAERVGEAAAAQRPDEWAELLREFEAAYRGLRSRLPGRTPGGQAADRLRRLLQRIIDEMGKVG